MNLLRQKQAQNLASPNSIPSIAPAVPTITKAANISILTGVINFLVQTLGTIFK